eukprot:TRINITY_DN23472_c0_g1_i2.p1 TRINITY_DN23472_c0_g1~~TRINITY_DN23472_c0_g1_i2.p1  ORF type:complete len:583 (-),score=96.35 TRINITY_DN23472_c0_g1_i2:67-1815(-)
MMHHLYICQCLVLSLVWKSVPCVSVRIVDGDEHELTTEENSRGPAAVFPAEASVLAPTVDVGDNLEAAAALFDDYVGPADCQHAGDLRPCDVGVGCNQPSTAERMAAAAVADRVGDLNEYTALRTAYEAAAGLRPDAEAALPYSRVGGTVPIPRPHWNGAGARLAPAAWGIESTIPSWNRRGGGPIPAGRLGSLTAPLPTALLPTAPLPSLQKEDMQPDFTDDYDDAATDYYEGLIKKAQTQQIKYMKRAALLKKTGDEIEKSIEQPCAASAAAAAQKSAGAARLLKAVASQQAETVARTKAEQAQATDEAERRDRACLRRKLNDRFEGRLAQSSLLAEEAGPAATHRKRRRICPSASEAQQQDRAPAPGDFGSARRTGAENARVRQGLREAAANRSLLKQAVNKQIALSQYQTVKNDAKGEWEAALQVPRRALRPNPRDTAAAAEEQEHLEDLKEAFSQGAEMGRVYGQEYAKAREQGDNGLPLDGKTLDAGSASCCKCSGWYPKCGPYRGMGGSCRTWVLSETLPWCWVEVGGTEQGEAPKRESTDYPGKYYTFCDPWCSNQPAPLPVLLPRPISTYSAS